GPGFCDQFSLLPGPFFGGLLAGPVVVALFRALFGWPEDQPRRRDDGHQTDSRDANRQPQIRGALRARSAPRPIAAAHRTIAVKVWKSAQSSSVLFWPPSGYTPVGVTAISRGLSPPAADDTPG